MCRPNCGRRRKRLIPTRRRTTGRMSTRTVSRVNGSAKDLLELVRSRDLELIVTTVLRPFVRSPPLKDRRMAEPRPLHVVVLDLADTFDSERLPGQVLARAPPTLTARHPGHLGRIELGPFTPWVAFERAFTQRRELGHQLSSRLHRERGGDADVVQRALVVVQAEKQRSDQRVLPVLVPAETRHHAVGGARVLDLDHGAL